MFAGLGQSRALIFESSDQSGYEGIIITAPADFDTRQKAMAGWLRGEHLSAAPKAAIRPAPFQPVKGAVVTPKGRPDSVESLAVVGERAPVAGQAARDRRGQLHGSVERVEQPLR
jgi:hypothetical protein